MKALSLLIKPVGDRCNLACKYCFYSSPGNTGVMSEDTLELIVQKAFDEAEEFCSFAFQGGEPTLAGLPFYEKFIELLNKYNTRHIKVAFALQTNGTLIDEAWADFLRKNHFLVGLSLDGTPEVHNAHRLYKSGENTHVDVLRAARLLESKRVDFNILCVITKAAARHPAQIYRYLRRCGFDYLQFIPCLDPADKPHGSEKYSLTEKDYAGFLKQLFDLWYEDLLKGKGSSIRYFDNLVQLAAGYPPESCGISGVCCCQNVIEADGSIYPCDFYVKRELCLGNIADISFSDASECETSRNFIDTSRPVPDECKTCRCYPLCRNGCKRERDERGKNYHCEALKEFFDYCGGRIISLARTLPPNR